MEYILITNKPQVARFAQDSGVHRVMVDLEMIGKPERQGHLDTVISKHEMADIAKIRSVLSKARLQVRINPLHPGSKKEIDQAIGAGADIVMLPMFTAPSEVEKFISLVRKRATVQLLVETPQAVARLDQFLPIPGIDEIHVGLNDLHLGMKLKFMFELLSGGLIEYLAGKITRQGIRFGFGGIARLGRGTVDASLILSEHFRLNSQMVILSRDFHAIAGNFGEPAENKELALEIEKINNYLFSLKAASPEELLSNKALLKERIEQAVSSIPD